MINEAGSIFRLFRSSVIQQQAVHQFRLAIQQQATIPPTTKRKTTEPTIMTIVNVVLLLLFLEGVALGLGLASLVVVLLSFSSVGVDELLEVEVMPLKSLRSVS